VNNAAAHIRQKNSFTYSPVPRTFDELAAVTKLTLLNHAYTLLGKEPNTGLLASLEEDVSTLRRRGRSASLLTTAELEDRIATAKGQFLSLL
jgi:hypothetical protein